MGQIKIGASSRPYHAEREKKIDRFQQKHGPRKWMSQESYAALKVSVIIALLARAGFGYVKGMRFGGKTILAEEKSHLEAYHKLVRETVSDIL